MFLLVLAFIPVTAFAQEAEVSAPTCVRILSATDTEAVLQFEPHGGERFEAERYVSGRWKPFSTAVRTSGKTHSVVVPLSRGNMNNIRMCALTGANRICGNEGVYAKR